MINSLFDKKTQKIFDELARQQAVIDEKKRKLASKSCKELDSETIQTVLKLVKENGHPNEKNLAKTIEEKYMAGIELEFDDFMDLDNLYKSNYKFLTNKGANDE